ncbi:hypothetical protein BASA50_004777 [Batrachochytrium salamandrivorans]|uniref:Uncharacterized protein n=1 Tax=Batrachochytrium salamandrivorans TaxID=1357716 RepID=A0ABQ8FF48_9FUNG|nr:hypothetical protein BASA60_007913 [Batrachochytrium salamandrivorans]KAH6570593.1 hypothetical protein BASA62_004284 [Batrachochytrium salamandrivorans]KAH6571687.1 hypothetical protein BASA62_003773 [Batrachochytrium salamandrivorans]KAH6590665.1 hypothetical protein BASA61_005185 [Batrachochytrium salamandrivorans]KAH6597019.1 hypothetical protein BASA50_004777 [Batrachochytrium salamandrivorans]
MKVVHPLVYVLTAAIYSIAVVIPSLYERVLLPSTIQIQVQSMKYTLPTAAEMGLPGKHTIERRSLMERFRTWRDKMKIRAVQRKTRHEIYAEVDKNTKKWEEEIRKTSKDWSKG